MSKELLKMFDLTGRVAVVTGGGGALGGSMAQALAEAGASVVIFDYMAEAAQRAAESLPGDALALQVDVTNAEQVRQVMRQAAEWKGRLDILVNAAGTHKIIETDKLAPEDWNRVIGVNLTGSFFCAQAAAPIMRDQGGGKIINIGSVMSRVGMPKRVAYASSKGGVVLLTRSLAQDWGPWKINVNAIAPGFFRTAMNEQLFQDQAWVDHLVGRIALGRVGQPQDLHGALIFLASPASDYVTGHVLFVDGGFTSGEPF